MRIGLNLVFLVPGETGGMETYVRELVPRLGVAAGTGASLVAFVSRAATGIDWGPDVEEVVVPVDPRDRKQWVWGEQRHLPPMAARSQCDVVHSLASTAPLHGSFARVTTVHDLNYKMVPEAHFGIRGRVMAMLVPAAARRSDRVIAISEATASDLREHLGLAPERIDVVPQGVAAPRVVPSPERDVRAAFDLGARRVLLTVSAKRPHKNLVRLLEAHARLGDDRPVLMLPGYATPHEDELRARATALGIDGDVRFVSWVSTEQLEGLYALADAFVFPSLYEGFGLPVLEAMARGVPVATSDRSALGEVAGDAALTFDPTSVDAIEAALRRLLDAGDGGDALRGRLRAAGRARAATFTWERTAAGTVASYERALADRR